MRNGIRVASLARRGFVIAMLFAAACAFPVLRRESGVTRHVAALPSDPDSGVVVPDSAAVELRGYSFSPHVEILTWTTDDANFGLRARLRRDGSLVRDHRLYVNTYTSVSANARFNSALTPTRSLRVTGVSRDDRACAGGTCLPRETFGARIPDELLRSSRDSLPVKFYASRSGHEIVVTLHRDLINVYLTTVDSVSAALRRK